MQIVSGTNYVRSMQLLPQLRVLTLAETKLVSGGTDSPDAGGKRKCEGEHTCGGNRCQDNKGECTEK
jgi:hypothetical protein